MDGYVVTARIDRGRPHVAATSAPLHSPSSRSWRVRPGAPAASVDMTLMDDDSLAVRWEAFRERWSQLTFFLFDGESWR